MQISSFRNTGCSVIKKASLSYFKNDFEYSEKKKISVIFVGENHKDPAPMGLTRQYMRELYTSNIDQIRCTEHPFDLTFEAQAKIINQWVMLNNNLLEIEAINQLAIHNKCAFPFFNEQDDKILQIIGNIFPHLEKKLHQSAMRQLYKYLYLQEVSFLNQQHSDLGLPYQGIERAQNECVDLSRKVMINPDILFQYEKIRIEAMTKNIVDKALPKLKNNGGVMWINTGLCHTLNLATSLHHHIVKNLLNHEYSFQMIATICYSSYVQNSIKSNLMDIPRSVAALENEELIALSKKIPVNLIEITEIGKHRYSALKLDPLIQNVIKNHSSLGRE